MSRSKEAAGASTALAFLFLTMGTEHEIERRFLNARRALSQRSWRLGVGRGRRLLNDISWCLGDNRRLGRRPRDKAGKRQGRWRGRGMESRTSESRDRLHSRRLIGRRDTSRASKVGRMRTGFATLFVVVVIVVTVVTVSLFRVGMAHGRIGASALLRSAWGTIMSCRVNCGNIILRGISFLSSGTTVSGVPASGRSCCRLRGRFTHFVCDITNVKENKKAGR
jgi:hypothetical protein